MCYKQVTNPPPICKTWNLYQVFAYFYIITFVVSLILKQALHYVLLLRIHYFNASSRISFAITYR
jgi:hypothetical protein